MREQKVTFWTSVIFGVVTGIAENDGMKGFQTFFETFEAPAGNKVFLFFNEILVSKNSTYSKQRNKNVYEDELSNAYSLLKISSNATDAEVKKARNAMILEFHPDKSQKDNEARTSITAKINEAYELIMKSRGKWKKNEK